MDQIQNSLQNQLRELSEVLDRERAAHRREHDMRLQLSRELDETKQELARQKKLKEMFINKGKETRDELERLKRASDPETISTMRLATEVHNNVKIKKKKVLQSEFEALVIRQEKLSDQLQAEQAENEALQQEVEQLKVSSENSLRYETQLKAERQKSHLLEKEIQRMSADLKAVKKMLAEKDSLVQKMVEEIQTLQRNKMCSHQSQQASTIQLPRAETSSSCQES